MNRLLSHLGPPVRAVRGVFRNRSIRRMQLAFLLFNVAEPAMWVAILVYAFNQGGTRAVGFVSILCLVPAGLLAPIAAGLGDRFPRERVVRWGYLTQAATTGVLAASLGAGVPPAMVYLLAMVACVPYTAGRPNHHALLPSLAHSPEEVAASNSVSALTEGIGYAIGGLTAAVLATIGAGAIVAVAAVSLGLAFVLTLGIHAPLERADLGAFRAWTLAVDAVDGIRRIATTRGTRILVLIAGALAIATGAIGVLLVPLAIDRLGLGDSGVGFLSTIQSVGLFVGAGVSVAFATRRRLAGGILAAAALYAIGGVLFGLATTTAIVVVAAIAYGASITLLDVLARTLLQRTTSDDLLTRVFGAVEALWLLAYAAGAALAPVLEARLGLPVSFAVLGCTMLAAGLVSFAGLRRIDAAAVVPVRQLELLSGIPMFAALPRVDLERIGRQLDLIATPAGTEVIRQGDVGDRFYIVDQGAFDIVRDGTRIDGAAAGGYFGEIALLHDVPRTATVRATVDGAVWALDQEEFLATVTGLPQAAKAAHEISAERRRTHTAERPREG
ncbi:MAG: MFS transporter [Actinomycetota bacterium]